MKVELSANVTRVSAETTSNEVEEVILSWRAPSTVKYCPVLVWIRKAFFVTMLWSQPLSTINRHWSEEGISKPFRVLTLRIPVVRGTRFPRPGPASQYRDPNNVCLVGLYGSERWFCEVWEFASVDRDLLDPPRSLERLRCERDRLERREWRDEEDRREERTGLTLRLRLREWE